MSAKIKMTAEFEEEAKKVAECTRKILAQAEEQIKCLYDKAKKEEWYTGPSDIIEDLLYDYCLSNYTQESWSNYCGADIILKSSPKTPF